MSKYVISSSPHLRDNVTTARIMQDVCIALLPAAVAGVLFFGYRSAVFSLVCRGCGFERVALLQGFSYPQHHW